MTAEPQSPNTQSPIYQPNWQVGTVNQSVNNYILSAERPPLWIDVPSLPAHFLGRDAIVAELVTRLTAGGSVALSAEGKPGVGKTTLAVALAHHREVLAHFSDGVLWAGLGTQPDLPSRLARWADALGVDVSDRLTVEARAQAVRDAIGHKKLLLVIDDAWQLEAAEHLRVGGPNCAHLLTSRDQRLAFAFAGRSQRVEELAPADALELLRRLAPKAVAVDEAESAGLLAAGLLAAVGYLPLAVELLGGYLAAGASARFAQASRSALADLTDPARRLVLATRRLGDVSGKRESLQETIALSIDGLAEESPAAVDAFYRLGAFAPKPASFDLAAAQAVAECDGDTGADALALLIERNLLEQDTDESLALHQTLADVARTRTPAQAVTRHRAHYLAQVNADREDWQAIEAIYPQIQHAWQHTPSNDPATVEFVDSLFTYLPRRGLWEEYLNWLAVALAAIEQNEDSKSQARMLTNYGFVYDALGEKEKALGYYAEALPLFRQVGDRSGEATTLNNIGLVYSALGEMEKALGYYEEALPLFRQVGDRSGEATTLNNIGGVYGALGEKEKALGYYAEALPLRRQVGDRSGEATTLTNIGAVYSALGEKEKALGYYAEALPLSRQVGDRSGEAATLNNIGLVYDALGEKEKALGYYEEALPLSRQVGDRFGESVTRFNIAMVFVDLGRLAEAEEQLEIVVQIDEAVRHPDLESDRRELAQVRAMRRSAE